ncbi:DUF4259 domain-containing protein [Streptomyces virginiae]|uniref:DUF4259 domain-containing protein n=1 Tax=Streptomyces virginiae TaxID=1961 RepID=UPI00367FF5FD
MEAAGESLIRGVLIRTIEAAGRLTEADEAVATAALIAAQCPGGAPVDTPYGPETPMPVLPAALRALADEALARIADDEEGTGSNWVAQDDRKRWRATLAHLRAEREQGRGGRTSVWQPPHRALAYLGRRSSTRRI